MSISRGRKFVYVLVSIFGLVIAANIYSWHESSQALAEGASIARAAGREESGFVGAVAGTLQALSREANTPRDVISETMRALLPIAREEGVSAREFCDLTAAAVHLAYYAGVAPVEVANLMVGLRQHENAPIAGLGDRVSGIINLAGIEDCVGWPKNRPQDAKSNSFSHAEALITTLHSAGPIAIVINGKEQKGLASAIFKDYALKVVSRVGGGEVYIWSYKTAPERTWIQVEHMGDNIFQVGMQVGLETQRAMFLVDLKNGAVDKKLDTFSAQMGY
jgi:hypothetical protein